MDRLKDERFAKFHKTFLEKIAPKYAFFENKREELLISIPIVFLTAVAILNTIAIIVYLADSKKNIPTLVFSFIILTIVSFVGAIIVVSKKYKIFLKTKIMPELLKAFGNIQWRNSNIDDYYSVNINNIESTFGLSKEEHLNFQNSWLFVNFNTCETDDIFEGNYKGINFKIAETILKAEGYKKISITSFRGLILNYDFNKKIETPAIVVSKQAKTQKDSSKLVIFIVCIVLAFICIPLLKLSLQYIQINLALIFTIVVSFLALLSKFPVEILMSKNENMDIAQKIILEDSKFNKKFDVYSSNQVEARYLVTPAFMEKFYNLKTVFGAKNIRCSFFDNNLMIAIETNKDLFEFGNIFKSVHDGLTIYQFYQEIKAIHDLIDYFKLNEKIYLT